jgi:outer membrane receptor for ferrienterochelin and colicins
MKIINIIILIFVSVSLNAQNKQSIKVLGSCGMCQERIEDLAKNTIGVISASWDEETKLLQLLIEPGLFQEKELHQKLADAGHDTDQILANDEIYNALPDCCRYRESEQKIKQSWNMIPIKKVTLLDDTHVQGIIYELSVNGKKNALSGASIQWKGTTVGTTSLSNGEFNLPMNKESQILLISYLGFTSEEIVIEKPSAIAVVLRAEDEIKEVTIQARRKTIEVSFISPIKMRKISQRELTKAACCNLSESFETNPAVDMSFTDAVTGTRQIEMLGLAGPYVQITRGNMPDVRGLVSIYGLSFIPGPWIKNIQLIQGSGSVINGFESIAGQINVDLINPSDNEKILINGYYGAGGRLEGNAVINTTLNDKYDANLLVHYNQRNIAHDKNFDGFLDNPKGEGFTISNNYNFYGENGNEGQFGVKITSQNNTSGQDNVHHDGKHPAGYELWKANINSNRYEAFLKRGKSFLKIPGKSIGFQFGGIYYDNKSLFGKRRYDGIQKMVYANFIYKTELVNKLHNLTLGSSFQLENSTETLSEKKFLRNEVVPGIFGEYAFNKEEKLNLVVGLRADHHSNYGLFFTPRIHGRYAFNESMVVRFSAGRGQRTANIIAENIGILASSRNINIPQSTSKKPYGLEEEVAWNYGLNMTYDVTPSLQWSVDAYYTNFNNQIIVDYDQSPQEVFFYNLSGRSYAQSLQTQFDYSGINGLELRLAYRNNDVKVDYLNGKLAKPLVSPHRAFINAGYEIKKYGLKLDYTINWQSSKRLPSTLSNPEYARLNDRSDAFYIHNTQVTKLVGKKYELYAGVENLFNFIQRNAIVDAGLPYEKYFDASMVWGPTFGAMWYTGFRYKINKE